MSLTFLSKSALFQWRAVWTSPLSTWPAPSFTATVAPAAEARATTATAGMAARAAILVTRRTLGCPAFSSGDDLVSGCPVQPTRTRRHPVSIVTPFVQYFSLLAPGYYGARHASPIWRSGGDRHGADPGAVPLHPHRRQDRGRRGRSRST